MGGSSYIVEPKNFSFTCPSHRCLLGEGFIPLDPYWHIQEQIIPLVYKHLSVTDSALMQINKRILIVS